METRKANFVGLRPQLRFLEGDTRERLEARGFEAGGSVKCSRRDIGTWLVVVTWYHVFEV